MKKVLFATTALVATAGVASADVAVSGMAEMGLFGGTGVAGDPAFFTDIDVTFTMSGETDNGLTFGAAVDLDEGGAGAAAVANNRDDGGIAIFLSGDFGTVTLGDTDGAMDWALTEAWVGNAGSINDDETGHAGALGSYLDGVYDGQILRYNYSIGDFGFAISAELDDAGVRDNGYAIGFRYGIDIGGGSVNLGLGYQEATTGPAGIAGFANTGIPVAPNILVTAIGVSAAVNLDNGLQAALQYSEWDFNNGVNTAEHLGLGVGYAFDAITVSANWGAYSSNNAALDATEGYGIAAAYDRGGGASVHVGYGNSSNLAGSTSSWSFGVAMSF